MWLSKAPRASLKYSQNLDLFQILDDTGSSAPGRQTCFV
jgi:hypothetical protein